jgi:type I restriction enzyme S subunit
MAWVKATLGEVCRIEKGNIGILKATQGDYPLVVLGEERRSHNEYQFDGDAVVIPLVSSTGHGDRSMKRIHFQSGKFSVGSILCAVMPRDSSILSAEFLYRYLDLHKEQELVSRMKGMANVSLSIKSVAEVEILLPPIQIQKEIVNSFKYIENQTNKLSSEQSIQLDFLKKLRQQILQDAIQGKLVPQDPNDEPASKLLKRINEEKGRLIKENKIKKDKPLPALKPNEIPFEIPTNWVWCRLGDMSVNHDGQRNPISLVERARRKKIYDYYGASGVIDKIDGFTHEGEYLLIGEDGANLKMKSTPIAFVANGKFWVNNHAHVLEFIDSRTLFYMENCLNGIDINGFITGGFQPKLSQGNLNLIPIPLPPLIEQDRIVTKIKQLMKLCDELEKSIQHSQKYTQELLHVALKEALVPKTN